MNTIKIVFIFRNQNTIKL